APPRSGCRARTPWSDLPACRENRESGRWSETAWPHITVEYDDRLKLQHPGVTVFGAEDQQRALRVPGQRRDRLAAVAAHQNFRAVLEPYDQHGAVAIASGHDVLLRMTGYHGDARLQRRQHRRLLAHRTVLAVERP